jgi:hypothetical protein
MSVIALPKQYEFEVIYSSAAALAAGFSAKHFLPAAAQRELCDQIADLLQVEHNTIALALDRVATEYRNEAVKHYAAQDYRDGDRDTARALSFQAVARFIRVRAARAAKAESCD